MGTFTGPQYRGAKRATKEIRREEAEKRNALTLPERRRAARA